MQVFEHREITKKHRRQPFYYSRWFCCMNDGCKTTQVHPDRFRVWNVEGEDRTNLESWLVKQDKQRRQQVASGESWPDGDTSGPPPWE
jgi:hypothetical protein